MKIKSINTIIALAITSLILGTVAISVLWTSGNTNDAVMDNQREAMLNLVNQSKTALDSYINMAGDQMEMLASQPCVIDAVQGADPKTADDLLEGLMASFGDYWAVLAFDENGMIVSGYNANGQSLKGGNRASRGYVRKILSGETDAYFSPSLLSSKSGDCPIFAAVHSVRDDEGNVVGGVGVFPRWDVFAERFISPIRIAEHGYGFVLDNQGRMIAHKDKDIFMQDVSRQNFAQIALTKHDGIADYLWQGEEKTMVFSTLPETGWIICMSAYAEDLAAAAITQRNILAVGGVAVAILLSVAMVFFIRRFVTTPVQGLLDFSSEIAEGNFRAELAGDYRLEFEALAERINRMVGELKNKLGFAEGVLKGMAQPCGVVGPDRKMLWTNRQFLELLERSGKPEEYVGMVSGEFFYHDGSRESLADKALKTKSTINEEIELVTVGGTRKNVQITATPFFDMDGELLGAMSIWFDVSDIRNQQKMIEEQNVRIARAAEEAEEISHSLSDAAEQLSSQILQASQGSETQKDRVTETATAMEEMNATVLEVARNASQAAEDAYSAKDNAEAGEQIVGKVVEAVSDVQDQADNLKSSMEDLGKQAANIGNILEVITDIADQTNLLALNAAIEAARAGEAGRGFAVVADEVRKLAEKTMAATSEVTNVITSIQSMTRSNVAASDVAAQSVMHSTKLAKDSGRALREIVDRVENAAEQIRSIAAASEQQSATSEEINSATLEINRISTETSRIMEEANQAIRHVAGMATKLNAVIESMVDRD